MGSNNPATFQGDAVEDRRGVSGASFLWRMLGAVTLFLSLSLLWLWAARSLGESGRLSQWLGAGPGRYFDVAGVATIGTVMLCAVVIGWWRREMKLRVALRDAEAMLLTSQKMEAFGVLSAGIAHDFSNTLQVIRGMAEFARVESYDPRVSRSAMEAIQLASFRGEEIARQLADFLGKPRDEFALRDINVVAREFSPILRQAAGPRTILAYELEDGIPATALSRTLVEQALLNLVINSRDAVALADPPRITIATKTVELIDQRLLLNRRLVSGRFVELSVTDNGCGISDEDLARAFAPFFTTKEKGTGLGLPSVLRAMQHHEGFVDVRSKTGAGTCIRLLIPIRTGVPSPKAMDPIPVPVRLD